jgi:hypothetical protein
MSKENPILATTIYTRGGDRYKLTAQGGLNYIRGNGSPYFSITADQRRAERGVWREDSCGCLHEEIETQWPGKFSDLIALHLSDINGVPMHFLGNGWYNLAACLGGAGERYHAGNSERHFPLAAADIDPAKPWQTTVYRMPTIAECFPRFAEFCRISLEEAQAIATDVLAELGPASESHSAPEHTKADYQRARAKWETIGATMLPRFKLEADACIARHSLTVYGDTWSPTC